MHEQALSLVAMAGNKEISDEVRRPADAIGRARATELDELRVRLRAWGFRPHGADFHGNPGELTMDELSTLYRLEGARFEREWLQSMRGNRRGAVALSRGEVARGLNLVARELAHGLVKVQEADLRELDRLLDD